MMVVHHERRQSFAHFLTSMCAIVGGVLTVASILDSFLFRTQKFVKKTANNTSGDPVIATRSGFGSSVKMM
ncbi:hypothetical protein FRB99_001727 [Tulasnella sp. 403]|nr:hypothetical protein FRB99_001727 [Tulasnella sp. 403]